MSAYSSDKENKAPSVSNTQTIKKAVQSYASFALLDSSEAHGFSSPRREASRKTHGKEEDHKEVLKEEREKINEDLKRIQYTDEMKVTCESTDGMGCQLWVSA